MKRLNANDVHQVESRKIVAALDGAVQCTKWNATATPPSDTIRSLPLLLRQARVYNLSSLVVPTSSSRRIMVGELRWGLALCGVWEGILIQHATHDVGPTMTAPIPALIFHRFYSRPSPLSLSSPLPSPHSAHPFQFAYHSYLDTEPSLPPRQPDILYRETCLSLRPAPLNKQLSK